MQKIEKWQIDAGLCSGKGRVRQLQEDAWYFSYEKADPADTDFISKSFCATTDSGGCAFAVFDGTGEGEYGREAACTAADWMKYLVRLSDRGMDLEKTLPAWSSIVNQKIRRDFPGAGTTMALAFFSGPTVQLAYIGDCRVYRFRAGKLEQQTRDHTQAELMVQYGLMTPQKAIVHPFRNTLYRYYGMENEMIGTAVEISEKYPLKESDRYILCTDGVYEMLTGDALNRLVSEAGSAVSCADLLYRQAIAEGGRDNLTVIVCEVRRRLLTDFSQSVFP